MTRLHPAMLICQPLFQKVGMEGHHAASSSHKQFRKEKKTTKCKSTLNIYKTSFFLLDNFSNPEQGHYIFIAYFIHVIMRLL